MTLLSNISKLIIQDEFEQENFFLTSNINLLLFLTHYKLIYKKKNFFTYNKSTNGGNKNIIECMIL